MRQVTSGWWNNKIEFSMGWDFFEKKKEREVNSPLGIKICTCLHHLNLVVLPKPWYWPQFSTVPKTDYSETSTPMLHHLASCIPLPFYMKAPRMFFEKSIPKSGLWTFGFAASFGSLSFFPATTGPTWIQEVLSWKLDALFSPFCLNCRYYLIPSTTASTFRVFQAGVRKTKSLSLKRFGSGELIDLIDLIRQIRLSAESGPVREPTHGSESMVGE